MFVDPFSNFCRIFLARNSVLRASSSTPAFTMYSLFEEMTDPIIVIDHLGIMHYVNKATEQLTGFVARNLKGRNVNILMTSGTLY